jgi:hypothetical protein
MQRPISNTCIAPTSWLGLARDVVALRCRQEVLVAQHLLSIKLPAALNVRRAMNAWSSWRVSGDLSTRGP